MGRVFKHFLTSPHFLSNTVTLDLVPQVKGSCFTIFQEETIRSIDSCKILVIYASDSRLCINEKAINYERATLLTSHLVSKIRNQT